MKKELERLLKEALEYDGTHGGLYISEDDKKGLIEIILKDVIPLYEHSLLMKYERFGCTYDYWLERGSLDAINQINAFRETKEDEYL